MQLEDQLPGIEKDLWRAADKLRGSLHPGEYQVVVLGLVVLRYLSAHGRERGFDIPPQAQWEILKRTEPSLVGAAVAQVVEELEQANPTLAGLLPHDWADGRIDGRRLRELVDLLSRLSFESSEDDDFLGWVYEYYLRRFAETDKNGSGEFYTPRSVVELLVDMLQPLSGQIYDPCCGTGGMFVRSLGFVDAHGAKQEGISVFGQELTATTWKLAQMNLLLRGIRADLGEKPADTFHCDMHPTLKADYVLANPPFNISEWGAAQLEEDPRWTFGMPPESSANFAWIQHILAHLSPTGTAGIVLSNGTLSGRKGSEAAIRARLVEAGVVRCIVALPSKLFYSTQIPASIWILSPNVHPGSASEVLFIDATRLGVLIGKTQRVLVESERKRIADEFHRWESDPSSFSGELGFSKAVASDDLARNGYNLSPPRHVDLKDEVVASEEISKLRDEVREMLEEGQRLDAKLLDVLGNVAP